jgi:hypothetical protein
VAPEKVGIKKMDSEKGFFFFFFVKLEKKYVNNSIEKGIE